VDARAPALDEQPFQQRTAKNQLVGSCRGIDQGRLYSGFE
jgi:hypothetical protein